MKLWKAKTTNLILEKCATKRPNCRKHKVEFVKIFRAIFWGIFWCEENFQEVAEHLNHGLLRDWNYRLKSAKQRSVILCLFLFCRFVFRPFQIFGSFFVLCFMFVIITLLLFIKQLFGIHLETFLLVSNLLRKTTLD